MLRHLTVKEVAAAQTADTEHTVNTLGSGIGKDNAAVSIGNHDAVTGRNQTELLRIHSMARMIEHSHSRLQQMRIPFDR